MPDAGPLHYQSREDFKKEAGLLRRVFGPSQQEIWGQFATQFDATFESGRSGARPTLVARADHWVLTLDVEVLAMRAHTRLRAPYVNPERFRFAVWREGLFGSIGKLLLGLDDIRVGDPDFDAEFVVTSNQPERARRLFSDSELRRLLHIQGGFEMVVRDGVHWAGKNFRHGIDELVYLTPGVVRDLKTLHDMYDLFARTLDLLCHVGNAYECDPSARL